MAKHKVGFLGGSGDDAGVNFCNICLSIFRPNFTKHTYGYRATDCVGMRFCCSV